MRALDACKLLPGDQVILAEPATFYDTMAPNGAISGVRAVVGAGSVCRIVRGYRWGVMLVAHEAVAAAGGEPGTGDETRTLYGMVYPDGFEPFADGPVNPDQQDRR